MKQLITTLSILLSFASAGQQVLPRTNTATTTNKSWQVFRQNSPTNVYGSSYVLLEVNYDSIYMHSQYVKVDMLDDREGFDPTKKFVTADSNGILFQWSMDSLVFPIDQIEYLDSMLAERITVDDGYTLFKPVDYVPTYEDIVMGIGFIPIAAEVDGSTTNEIELPSQIGNAGKFAQTNGTSVSWTAIKRQETYSGITNASGTYTVTFATAFSVVPNIQANIVGGTDSQIIRITSVSTTGFTVLVRNRVDVIGLLPSWNNVSGATVDILITEK